MSPASRAPSLSTGRRRSAAAGRGPVAVYGGARQPVKPRLKAKRPAELAAASLDLAGRLKLFQRVLRDKVERREALVDIIRAVNTTLEPVEIAELVVERAATWVPAPCWAVVSSDQSGQLSVLADRGLESDMGSALFGIAAWVMDRGEEFTTADLARDTRVSDQSVATVVALPLTSRGRRVGALIGLDRTPSSKEPKLGTGLLEALHILLEPAAVALDNALLLKRTEALPVTDDLTRLYNSRYLNNVLRRETK